jgi:hypothetical protein
MLIFIYFIYGATTILAHIRPFSGLGASVVGREARTRVVVETMLSVGISWILHIKESRHEHRCCAMTTRRSWPLTMLLGESLPHCEGKKEVGRWSCERCIIQAVVGGREKDGQGQPAKVEC